MRQQRFSPQLAWVLLLASFLFIPVTNAFDNPRYVIPEQLNLNESQTEGGQTVQAFSELAGDILKRHFAVIDLRSRFRLELLAGKYKHAIKTIQTLRASELSKRANADPLMFIEFEIFARAKNYQITKKSSFDVAYSKIFGQLISGLRDQQAHKATNFVTIDLNSERPYLKLVHGRAVSQKEVELQEALRILVMYQDFIGRSETLDRLRSLVAQDRNRRYDIQTDVLIKTPQGITLSAMVVRKKGETQKQPSILTATIYSEESSNLQRAIEAAAHGYIGVISDSRGKRLSRDTITPYENETIDVNVVIDWISKQSWSDGRVAMYGSSYLGYTQWAATKSLHPALKTIVPTVAAIPGQGLPMENNIFLNANYAWPFFVSNGRYNDGKAYTRKNWRQVNHNWYLSGQPYRQFDKLEGKPNPWLQRWLSHPAYDAFWQTMVPYQHDYENIDIPVLTFTGYYDDGQISALHYFNEHYQYNKKAEHYLVIGPYDHFGSQILQEENLRGYRLDSVAHIDVTKITFQWFDHVLRGKNKPSLIKNKVNYQLMGDNSWRHVSSLEEMKQKAQRYYLSTLTADTFNRLTTQRQDSIESLQQTVDLSDRNVSHNGSYYPYPIQKDALEIPNGFSFISEPFDNEMEVSGQMTGKLSVEINKKDFDVGLVLYELLPDGSVFHLTYYLGRASYAKDMSSRHLLVPYRKQSVPFERVRMVGKKIAKGSRLLLLVNVNVNPHAQINYGTGKDVSEESIADAKTPLVVKWLNDSYVDIPIRPYVPSSLPK